MAVARQPPPPPRSPPLSKRLLGARAVRKLSHHILTAVASLPLVHTSVRGLEGRMYLHRLRCRSHGGGSVQAEPGLGFSTTQRHYQLVLLLANTATSCYRHHSRQRVRCYTLRNHVNEYGHLQLKYLSVLKQC